MFLSGKALQENKTWKNIRLRSAIFLNIQHSWLKADNYRHSAPKLNGSMQTYPCQCCRRGQRSWEGLAKGILTSRKVLWETAQRAVKALANLLPQGVLVVNEMSVLTNASSSQWMWSRWIPVPARCLRAKEAGRGVNLNCFPPTRSNGFLGQVLSSLLCVNQPNIS